MTAKLLILTLKPKHREQALALAIACGVTTLEEKRVGPNLQLHLQIPKQTNARTLSRQLTHPIFLSLKTKILKDESWKKAYQRFLTPFIFPGPSGREALVIDPVGPYPKKPPLNTLIIQGQLAFGTGQHPSTQLAGYLLQKILAHRSISSLMDVGSGTGILAMVAYQRGLKDITAVENDPEARAVAKKNFRGNGIRGISLMADLSQVRRRYPLIVANILAKTLIELKGALTKRLVPKGSLVLSGLNYRDIPEVLQAYRGFRLVERKNKWGWAALWLEKKRVT